jgi:hypothetical protein
MTVGETVPAPGPQTVRERGSSEHVITLAAGPVPGDDHAGGPSPWEGGCAGSTLIAGGSLHCTNFRLGVGGNSAPRRWSRVDIAQAVRALQLDYDLAWARLAE